MLVLVTSKISPQVKVNVSQVYIFTAVHEHLVIAFIVPLFVRKFAIQNCKEKRIFFFSSFCKSDDMRAKRERPAFVQTDSDVLESVSCYVQYHRIKCDHHPLFFTIICDAFGLLISNSSVQQKILKMICEIIRAQKN